jgi:hypothetical protein
MTVRMTDKQRRGMEALEAAQGAGLSLSEYAKVHGLVVRELYDGIAALRKRGVLPKSARGPKRVSRFVPVQVVSSAVAMPSRSPIRGGMVCRLIHANGLVIECGEWPPAAWLAAVLQGSRDAAP